MTHPSPLFTFLWMRYDDMPDALPSSAVLAAFVGGFSILLAQQPIDLLPAAGALLLCVGLAWHHFRPHWWGRIWHGSTPSGRLHNLLSDELRALRNGAPHAVTTTFTLPPLSAHPTQWGFFDSHTVAPANLHAAIAATNWSARCHRIHPADLFVERFHLGTATTLTVTLPPPTAHEILAHRRRAVGPLAQTPCLAS